MKQHFFIEGRYLGEVERFIGISDERRGMLPLSLLLYCPECGDPWARFPVEYKDGRIATWSAYAHTCRKHKGLSYGQRVPGSIWVGFDSDFTGALPLSVLLWEVQRELDFYDWSQNGES